MKFGLKLYLALLIAPVIAGNNVDLTASWKFSTSNPENAYQRDYNDSDWENVDLPHDWSILGPYDKDNPSGGQGAYLPAGIGWYRKNIELETIDPNSRYLILFDGVFMNSTVWINGEKVGGRPYGYISFYFDITDKLVPGVNSIAVRVDDEKVPNARWYAGCGIYGNVHLIVKNKINFDQWGIFVSTPHITNDAATVAVEAAVNNGTGKSTHAVIKSVIVDTEGSPVASNSRTVHMPANDQLAEHFEMKVANPSTWSPDSPYLYTLISTILVDGNVKHSEKVRFGIRSLRFGAKEGFFLNGVHTKLKGVCEHSDGGPVGAAIPEKVLRRRLRILKEMGCNAIRTAHNPRRPIFYELCDEMGMMVLDEIFDGWHRKARYGYSALHFKDWWKTDVRDWVRRDRNHPSVIMYSLGNETGIYDEFNISGEVKKYDSTRPTTGGSLLFGVDIPGFNAPGANPGVLEKFHRENPDKAVVLTEVPHTLQTRGFYRTMTWWRNPKNLKNYFAPYNDKQIFFDGHSRYNSSYDNAGVRITARQSWKRTKENPWILGEFRWTGFDYLGEASFGGGKWPARIWNFGIIDLCGFPKDHYYFYQSQWTQEPMVHILPHWTHPGMEGVQIPVVGYSNCEEMELFLNGKSLGRRRPGELLDFVWKVPYQPGELKAVGYRDGKIAASEIIKTAQAPTEIKLSADNLDLKPNRNDISHVTISIQDQANHFVPWACSRIDFKIEGPVRLLGFDNGDPLDVTSHRETYRNTFNGLALGIFQGIEEQPGPIEITAAGILGRTRFEDKTTIAIDVSRIALRGQLEMGDFDITYAVNGLSPVHYDGPFELSATATVKAVITRNAKRFMTLESEFVKGPLPRVTDKRFENPEPRLQQTFDGPTANQLVGEWVLVDDKKVSSTNRVEVDSATEFIFTPTGSAFVVKDGKKRLFGFWTYEYPENPKDSSDVGSGKMFMFVTDACLYLNLDSQDAKLLKMKSRFKNYTLRRKD